MSHRRSKPDLVELVKNRRLTCADLYNIGTPQLPQKIEALQIGDPANRLFYRQPAKTPQLPQKIEALQIGDPAEDLFNPKFRKSDAVLSPLKKKNGGWTLIVSDPEGDRAVLDFFVEVKDALDNECDGLKTILCGDNMATFQGQKGFDHRKLIYTHAVGGNRDYMLARILGGPGCQLPWSHRVLSEDLRLITRIHFNSPGDRAPAILCTKEPTLDAKLPAWSLANSFHTKVFVGVASKLENVKDNDEFSAIVMRIEFFKLIVLADKTMGSGKTSEFNSGLITHIISRVPKEKMIVLEKMHAAFLEKLTTWNKSNNDAELNKDLGNHIINVTNHDENKALEDFSMSLAVFRHEAKMNLLDVNLVVVLPKCDDREYRVLCVHAGLSSNYQEKDPGSLLYHFPVKLKTVVVDEKTSVAIEWENMETFYVDKKKKSEDIIESWATDLNIFLKSLTIHALNGWENKSNFKCKYGKETAEMTTEETLKVLALLGGPETAAGNYSPASGQNIALQPLRISSLGGVSTYVGLGHIPSPFGVGRANEQLPQIISENGVMVNRSLFSVMGRADTQYFRPSVAAQLVVPRHCKDTAEKLIFDFLGGETQDKLLLATSDDFMTFKAAEGDKELWTFHRGPIVKKREQIQAVFAKKGFKNFIFFMTQEALTKQISQPILNTISNPNECEFVPLVFGRLAVRTPEDGSNLYPITSFFPEATIKTLKPAHFIPYVYDILEAQRDELYFLIPPQTPAEDTVE